MATTAVETVTCNRCGLQVTPTREGGTRPRDHHNPDGVPCDGPKQGFTLPNCARCGGAPDKPQLISIPGQAPRMCVSPLFHPEQWHDDATNMNVGNAAAAGEIVMVSGQQYQWLVRIPPPGNRKAPGHVGYRPDGVRVYDLDAVREYVKHRPGPGGAGPAANR
jgi:hypothetical protein